VGVPLRVARSGEVGCPAAVGGARSRFGALTAFPAPCATRVWNWDRRGCPRCVIAPTLRAALRADAVRRSAFCRGAPCRRGRGWPPRRGGLPRAPANVAVHAGWQCSSQAPR